MFRFSIREMMLVTVVVAVCGGWWADRQSQARGEKEWKFYATCLETLLTNDGFEILRDKDWVRATRISPSPNALGSSNTVPPKPVTSSAPDPNPTQP